MIRLNGEDANTALRFIENMAIYKHITTASSPALVLDAWGLSRSGSSMCQKALLMAIRGLTVSASLVLMSQGGALFVAGIAVKVMLTMEILMSMAAVTRFMLVRNKIQGQVESFFLKHIKDPIIIQSDKQIYVAHWNAWIDKATPETHWLDQQNSSEEHITKMGLGDVADTLLESSETSESMNGKRNSCETCIEEISRIWKEERPLNDTIRVVNTLIQGVLDRRENPESS